MRFNLKTLSLTLVAGLTLTGRPALAQDENVIRPLAITTAVPFMLIAPDARGGSMGETGVATAPDVNSMHWNPAKYAFIDKQMGFSVSYSPWLKQLVDDIGLGYLTGYYKLNKREAIAGSLRYFSLGSIQFTDEKGHNLGDPYNPNEFNFSGTYSRLFTDNFSGAVSAKFIYSNLTQGQNAGSQETHAGTSIAADVSIYYRKPLNFSAGQSGQFALGVNISNIGSKISYTSDVKKDFIPTQLRIGPALTYNIDDYNSITGTVEFTKLLVPTPPIYYTDSVDINNQQVIYKGKSDDVSVIQGMLQSFYDAPDGFSEELKEITWALGVEYWYNKQFAIRGGYHHESADKGDRKFFTFGAGLRYNVFGLDFSYLVSTDQRNPLDNTLRFSLTFDMDAFRAQE
ncbi:MAG: type IX secretion system outer membrane channel protein PorV [Bacteroidales bacterium]|nr:type IX secretion system outer membrane channel protein PorV [Bacteroidales bacterium]MDD3666935.1 type IX secretion system outer membrane channel protein PorV [Bacteroidales bacterium]